MIAADGEDPCARTAQKFPVLSVEMIGRTTTYGCEERLSAGTTLFARGDREADFLLIIAGEVGIFYSGEAEDEERLLTVHRHGQFSSELDHVSARALLVTARALTSSRVVRVPAASSRRLLAG
ncbi:cyclic nucleotide-binding domain-containing protein [Sphingomonas sp. BIUV-7]|uniref:Cyclic nucleotide-binding domain-containing protein n=1 Tax=Sphingomonas natans TaxID=3063330 RepID=A0ABT8Y7B8_9SPHN|nr:cyclic nucleotide-binding domain-containing protein [Sphingomonas sp. BIUV-7]MDO6414212.1 cyclic nucleotide-binding domain-containing protein [Sphingomonas sp. BIUV-7]